MKQEYGEISIFDIGKEEKRIRKPIRLIEFFAGYGSQALALKYLGVPFEHHKISEWAVPSIKAYKDLHFEDDKNDYSADMTVDEIKAYLCGRISQNYNVPMSEKQIKAMKEETARGIYSDMVAEHNLGSICLVHGRDLEIEGTEKYEYILTYSFPCQDLSNSGKRAGMEKGSGTRSGMLWEVERILNELNEWGPEHLPQILLMENVPAVCGSGNIKVFAEWLDALEKLSYGNYYKILNAADYKIPQNRERCFMVSLLGDEMFEFPAKMPLELRLRDVLEKEVDEKYYLSDKAVESFIAHTEKMKEKGNGFKFEPTGGGGYAKCITTRAGSRCDDNFIDDKLLAEWRDSPDDKKPLCKSGNCEFSTERRVERTRDNGADGIYLGQSDEFCRGGYKDIARAITTQGKNGVIEWET